MQPNQDMKLSLLMDYIRSAFGAQQPHRRQLRQRRRGLSKAKQSSAALRTADHGPTPPRAAKGCRVPRPPRPAAGLRAPSLSAGPSLWRGASPVVLRPSGPPEVAFLSSRWASAAPRDSAVDDMQSPIQGTQGTNCRALHGGLDLR